MKLKSRGLGRKELVMDFREYRVVREGGEVMIMGTIHEPVNWDFSIRVCEDDLAGIIQVGRQRAMIGLLLRALLKPRKHHHWSGDHGEHVTDARTRRRDLKDRLAAQKAKTKAAARAEREAAEAQREEPTAAGLDVTEDVPTARDSTPAHA